MGNRPSWPEYAMLLAEVAASRSQDMYEKVGACVLRHDYSVGGLGYNNPPPGIDLEFMEDRDRRRPFMSHAELSALRYLRPNEGFLIACTLRPCSFCITQIAMYGITNVFYKKEYEREPIVEEIAKTFNINLVKLN
jgi:deoxycytidylate deaminase